MSELPKIVQARLTSLAGDAHPDADVLTAFYEQALAENERGPVLAHLAQCSECRDVVALALPTVEERVRVAGVASPAWGWAQMVRWGSVVACVVVVGAAVLIHKPSPVAVRPSSEAEVVLPEPDAAKPGVRDQDEADKGMKPAATAPAQLGAHAAEKKATAGVQPEARVVSHAEPPAKAETAVAAQSTANFGVGSGTLNIPANVPAAPAAAGGQFGGLSQKRAIRPAPRTSFLMNDVQAIGSANIEGQPSSELKTAETPGRAKTGNAGVANDAAGAAPRESILAKSFSKADQATPAGESATQGNMPARWMLSPEGQLQRSFDSGKTWEPVPVMDRAKFTALSVRGLEIWVGGAAGVLYHSADNGWRWTVLNPTVDGSALIADIKSLAFTDPQHGAMTTSDGQALVTADGGRTWQKQP